ncbi:transposase, partial [Escherichia coli]|nr:transposase [Escherichia coli]
QRYAHCHPLNRSRLSFIFYTVQG